MQIDVAKPVGMAQGQLSRCERGIIRPSRERLASLAQVLDLDLAELLVLADYVPPERQRWRCGWNGSSNPRSGKRWSDSTASVPTTRIE